MKSTSVRGTPVRSISADNGQGFLTPGARPKGMSGTVNRQFEGDQSGNRQTGLNTGTPYQTRSVNDDIQPNPNRMKYGVNNANGQGDMDSPTSNGNGVLFDGISEAADLVPSASAVTDSPVPTGAQKPAADATEVLANLRSGVGKQWGPSDGPGNNFQDMGGVMSRGMQGKSHASGGEMELLEDDVLRNLGAGGAV